MSKPIEKSTAQFQRAWENAGKTSRAHWDGHETDIRLDLALGKAEDVSAYQDCIQGARREGARARQERP